MNSEAAKDALPANNNPVNMMNYTPLSRCGVLFQFFKPRVVTPGAVFHQSGKQTVMLNVCDVPKGER